MNPRIDPAEIAPQTPPGVAPEAALGLAPVLATALRPLPPSPAQDARLHDRLMARVTRSAEANRPFVTTRVHDGAWQPLGEVVQVKPLQADAQSQSSLLAWRAEGGLTLPAGACLHECVVLAGELHAAAAPHAEAPRLRRHDHALFPGERPLSLWACAGTRVYWRRVHSALDDFGHAAAPQVAHADALAWAPLRPGVAVKPLHAQGERISMLVQFEPGASVPAHGHAHGEACLMVSGDLFLGDVLLREGDFQFAPAGSAHGGLHSDVGCLLFFHGAIDPAVAEPLPA